jgi:hypothetical protein
LIRYKSHTSSAHILFMLFSLSFAINGKVVYVICARDQKRRKNDENWLMLMELIENENWLKVKWKKFFLWFFDWRLKAMTFIWYFVHWWICIWKKIKFFMNMFQDLVEK